MTEADRGTALVTGASTGIGLATARALRDAGFRVFGTSRRAGVRGPNGVIMLTCDVTDDASVAKLIADVGEKIVRIERCAPLIPFLAGFRRPPFGYSTQWASAYSSVSLA